MDIVLKIQSGTTRGGNLCRTCRYAHIVRGVNNEQFVKCSAGQNLAITFEVAECNRFAAANMPSLYEMEQIGWPLITKIGGRVIGFVNPKEFIKKNAPDFGPSS